MTPQEVKETINTNEPQHFYKIGTVLPTIGNINKNALKKGNLLRLDKKEYLLIPSQFIAFLVGFIDGDGYIQITKTTKGYIAIKLVIALQLKDLSTLEYIQNVLKLGKITILKDQRNPLCKLIINRTDLQEVIFPLLLHHNIFFLTKSRIDQFNLAMFIFKQDIKFFDLLPAKLVDLNTSEFSKASLNKENSVRQSLPMTAVPIIFNLPNEPKDYLNLPFFYN